MGGTAEEISSQRLEILISGTFYFRKEINMNKIFIADSTIAQSCINNAFSMSFKEKMEVAKRLEKIKVNVIEMPKAVEKTDALLIKSLSSMIKESTLSVAAAPDKAEIDAAADAIKNSKNARIRVLVPTSPVQMEYILKAKPKAVLEKVPEMVAYAKTLVNEIEVSFIDTSRSEKEFVAKLSQGVIASGATILDFCDTAGTWLPEETADFIKYIKENVRGIENVTISVACSDEIRLGNANSVAAIKAGATQVKTTLVGKAAPKIGHFVNLISEKGEAIGVNIDIPRAEFNKTLRQMTWIEGENQGIKITFEEEEKEKVDDLNLDETADISKVIKAIKKLGYDLSDDDNAKVYKEFKRVSEKKKIGTKEMEAIIATAALQVPATYQLVDFVINSGNIITPTACITLEKEGNELKGLSSGDGPIAAAFLAVEMVVGHHYELDDFQIQSVTEGSEAVGTALVKLRSNGKLYSGNGISTDIIGASIRAYLNAINKIVYEEKQYKKPD